MFIKLPVIVVPDRVLNQPTRGQLVAICSQCGRFALLP